MKPFIPVTLASLIGLGYGCGAALADNRLDHSRFISTYAPVQGFNHVVGPKRFVGYFMSRKGSCDVTVIVADADDERLETEPLRHEVRIPAADRAEFAADKGHVLAVGCTVDADYIKVVPLSVPDPIVSSQR